MVEDRIRAALREIVTAHPVPLKERKRWPAAALAGLAVVAIVAAVALAAGWQSRRPQPVVAAGGEPTLPEEFPGYSLVQGDMDGPFGRVIAFYHNGTGHEDFSFSQLIVAGADENKFRRVDLESPQPSGPIYARLTPDGTKLVAGAAHGVITVIDLLSGQRRDYPTAATQFTAPLAVSADGRRVAYSVYGQFAEEGIVYLLDLPTGQVSAALGVNARHVAFSPSGALALQIDQTVKVAGWSGEVAREIQLPDSTELAGPQSWTPDGKFLVTVHTGQSEPRYAFQPVDPATTPVPQPISARGLVPGAWGDHVLGWRSPSTMLVSGSDVNGTTSNLIVEVDIAGGAHRVIGRFRVGPNDDLAVGDVQLATGLLAEMGTRSGANPDRGPWPTWTIVTAVLCLVVVALIVIVARRPRRWRRNQGDGLTSKLGLPSWVNRDR